MTGLAIRLARFTAQIISVVVVIVVAGWLLGLVLFALSAPRSAADINDSPVSMGEDVSVRRLSGAPKPDWPASGVVLGTVPAVSGPPVGKGEVMTLGSGAPFIALDQEAGDTKVGGAGSGFQPVPPTDLPSATALDLADFALPTPLVGFGGLHPIAESWYRGVAAGKASHMGAGFPAWYLALPIGPGFRVEIVGAGGKVTRVSTDAGPALSMQRPPYNRVADLNVWDFLAVCGVPLRMGLCQVSVTILGRV